MLGAVCTRPHAMLPDPALIEGDAAAGGRGDDLLHLPQPPGVVHRVRSAGPLSVICDGDSLTSKEMLAVIAGHRYPIS